MPEYQIQLPEHQIRYDGPIDVHKIGADMMRLTNCRLHAQHLSIPVLADLKLQTPDNPQTIMIAVKPGMTEQLVSDGFIGDQTLEQHTDFVLGILRQTATGIQEQFGINVLSNDVAFIESYKTEGFLFKVYLHDQRLIDPNGVECALRNVYAFFVDEPLHDFYQMSLSVGPLQLPLRECRLGVVNLPDDPLLAGMVEMMHGLMDNLRG